jgi:hypothetical protein
MENHTCGLCFDDFVVTELQRFLSLSIPFAFVDLLDCSGVTLFYVPNWKRRLISILFHWIRVCCVK